MKSTNDGGLAVETLSLDGAGQWFIIAISMDHVNTDLSVMNSNGEVVAEDMQPDWYPFVAMETDQSETMTVNLTSKQADMPYRLFLYRAVKGNGQS